MDTGRSLATKARAFRDRHGSGGIFILPNPWDVGSARMLAALGFEALATTSAGSAFAAGRIDWVGETTREQALAHAAEIADATSLPVSADLEDGFGPRPEDVAETVRGAAAAGLCGCTIEDTTGDRDTPIHDAVLATERIVAAVEAVRGLDRPFALTARAENYLHERPNLDDTLERLSAFEKAGADVLYAPGLPDLETVRTVCEAVSKPVNVVAGIGLEGVSIADLEAAGVKRISLGSALARVAIGAMLRAARATLVDGDLNPYASGASFSEIENLIKTGTPETI